MKASELLELAAQPAAWRRRARALRRCAAAAWSPLRDHWVHATRYADPDDDVDHDGLDALDGVKLLYGYALEAALKGWIVQRDPAALEIAVTMNGSGQATKARIVSLAGRVDHDLVALANTAGLFKDPAFTDAIPPDRRSAVRNLCQDLAEAVLWRARYPTPIASDEPLKPHPRPSGFCPWRLKGLSALRELLDPVLDVLLAEPANSPVDRSVP